MTLNILGTEYNVIFKDYTDEEYFALKGIDGYCNNYTKEIVVCNLKTYDEWRVILEQMVKGFELLSSDRVKSNDEEQLEKDTLILFGE